MNDTPAAAPDPASEASPRPPHGASLDARADSIERIFERGGETETFKALYEMSSLFHPDSAPGDIAAYVDRHEIPEGLVREYILDLLISGARDCKTSLRDAVAGYPLTADLPQRPEVEQAAREGFAQKILKNPTYAVAFAKAFPIPRDVVLATLRRVVSSHLRLTYFAGTTFGHIGDLQAPTEVLRAFADYAAELMEDPILRGTAQAVLEEFLKEREHGTEESEAFAQAFGLAEAA